MLPKKKHGDRRHEQSLHLRKLAGALLRLLFYDSFCRIFFKLYALHLSFSFISEFLSIQVRKFHLKKSSKYFPSVRYHVSKKSTKDPPGDEALKSLAKTQDTTTSATAAVSFRSNASHFAR